MIFMLFLYKNFFKQKKSFCLPTNPKPEAHGPQRSPECTAMKAIIQPKYCKCCMQEKLTFRLPWQLIKFSSLDLIYMAVRGLLKEHYCKAFVKIPKVS